MLKSKAETQELIKMIFASERIEINNIEAGQEDVIALCERLTQGKERVYAPVGCKKYGRIERICINTY